MDSAYLSRLTRPEHPVDVVMDTDTCNEIDDPFALAYLALSGDRLRLRAIYAAPFFNDRSSSPSDGMERSFQEIHYILSLMGRTDLKQAVYRGSERFLPDENTPVESPAARHLIELSARYTPQRPLYVVAIGAITNVASALLLDPTLSQRIAVIWLGGHAHHWPNSREFNLLQDVAAGRILFGSGTPVVQLPCMGVVSAFTTSGPELEHWLRGKNALCDYLANTAAAEAQRCGQGPFWTRPIWDVTAVAWLISGEFMEDCLTPSPIPQYDHRYSFDPTRHPIRYVYHIHRDKLMEDLFTKLSREGGPY